MERIRGVIKRTEAGEEDRKKSYEDANQWKLLKSDKGTFVPGTRTRLLVVTHGLVKSTHLCNHFPAFSTHTPTSPPPPLPV